VGGRHFDALIFGYWEGDRLMYAAHTRSGFTPAVREQLHQRFQGLEVRQCRWLKPVLVGRFEFVEWTPDKHLRHSRFVGLREE
jgi:ATP-dependent DNA ligase